MDELELLETWGKSSSDEQLKLEDAKRNINKLTKSKSNDIFKRIKKNIILEIIVSIPLVPVVPLVFWNQGVLFWLSLVITVLSVGAGFVIYGGYLKNLRAINDMELVISLEKKIRVLSTYVKQLNFYLVVFGTLGFGLGFGSALGQQGVSLPRLALLIVITTPFLYLIIWLGRKYIHLLYGKHLKHLKDIYDDLVAD